MQLYTSLFIVPLFNKINDISFKFLITSKYIFLLKILGYDFNSSGSVIA